MILKEENCMKKQNSPITGIHISNIIIIMIIIIENIINQEITAAVKRT